MICRQGTGPDPAEYAITAAVMALRYSIGDAEHSRLMKLLGVHGFRAAVRRMLDAADKAYLVSLRAAAAASDEAP